MWAFAARYIVDGAFEQPGCTAPARQPAQLSMQTSLTSNVCGPILIVTAHRG